MLSKIFKAVKSYIDSTSLDKYYQEWVNEQVKDYNKLIKFNIYEDDYEISFCARVIPAYEIYVSSGALLLLTDKEIKANIAHEIAHIMDPFCLKRKNHHAEYLADLESVKYGGNYDDLMTSFKKMANLYYERYGDDLMSINTDSHPCVNERINNVYCLKRYFEI